MNGGSSGAVSSGMVTMVLVALVAFHSGWVWRDVYAHAAQVRELVRQAVDDSERDCECAECAREAMDQAAERRRRADALIN